MTDTLAGFVQGVILGAGVALVAYLRGYEAGLTYLGRTRGRGRTLKRTI